MQGLGGSWVRSFCVGVVAAASVACGGSDDEGDGGGGSDCGTVSNPDSFVIANVEPAVGASVPNAAIVHRFKIVGDVFVDTLPTTLPAAHTAGEPVADPTWMLTRESDGTAYASSPVTWATAPGHVEVNFTGVYAAPNDCVLAFPSPIFSYEVTAP